MADTESSEQGFRLTPIWFRDLVADKVSAVLYGFVDVIKQGARDAVRAGLIELAPDDAIPYHGRARMLDPVDGESIGSWRERLVDAWDFWSSVTGKVELQEALRLYMKLPTSLFVYDFLAAASGGDDWLAGSTGVLEDSNYDNASRLVVVIEQPHPWTRPVVGPDLVVGPGLMVGLTMTMTELSRIRKYFQLFRPAHVVGSEIYVIMDTSPAEDFVGDHGAGDRVRLPLHAPMVGYPSMAVGPTLIVGAPFT